MDPTGHDASNANSYKGARDNGKTSSTIEEEDRLRDINHPVLNNPRTGSGLKTYDGQHGFNDIIDNYAQYAKEFDIVGGDGISRRLYQIEGGQKSYQDKLIYDKLQGFERFETTTIDHDGVFEWIIDPIKGITHRRFILNGKITGAPNQRL